MTAEDLEELLGYYEVFEYAENPKTPEAYTAKLLFQKKCKDLYEAESDATRKSFSLDLFKAEVVTREVLDFAKQRQSEFPSVQPERLR